MTKITNTDTRRAREATIITKPAGDIRWCIATWPAPEYGFSKADGNGHAWQCVALRDNGTYTYNNTMPRGFRDSLDDVKALAIKYGYELG